LVEYRKSTLLLAGYIVFTFVTESPQPVELANEPLHPVPLQVAAKKQPKQAENCLPA
jgi:hypothetical protein